MTYDPNVYGYVDGQPTYSRDEFIYKKRRRGPITDDAELVAFAEKATSGWYNAGWRRTFTTEGATRGRSHGGRPLSTSWRSARTATPAEGGDTMNSNTILTLSDELLERYRSSIPRKAFEQFVEDITTGPAATAAPKFDVSLLCRASFPAELEDDGGRCTVEVTVYRLNAVAVNTFLLDGPEPLRRHLGIPETDTYITKHDIDDLVTVVRIIREEAPAWQH